MANVFVTPTTIAKEAALQVVNNMVMGNLVHRDFKNEFVKVGATVQYRKPVKFVVNDGANITSQIQDVKEYNDTITVDQRKNVAFAIPTQDLTLTIEKISERYITPASIRLANAIDASLHGLYTSVYNAEGTAGTTPNTFALLGAPSKKLNKYAVPMEDRRLVLGPDAHFQAADVLKALNSPKTVEGAIRRNYIGPLADMDTYMSQNVKTHTAGVLTGTPLVNGTVTAATAPYSGTTPTTTSVPTDGWTNSITGIVKAGDILTFAGCYGVNPVSGDSTGELQQFVVTADADSGATTGPATIIVSPPMIVSGAYRTVTAVPADNAVVGITATHVVNMAFQKNAFALVTCPLEVPEDAKGSMMNYKDVAIRYIKWYDGRTDEQIFRLDALWGVKCVYPEYACRLRG